MTRITQSTCKFCGVDYTRKMSGSWPKSVKDTRPRSSSLCPDCYREVMAGIELWSEGHSRKKSCAFVEKLLKRGLSAQAVLAVLVVIEETCTICWDGEKDCVCGQNI